VAKRSLTEITINEILRSDIDEFVRINDVVEQAEKVGLRLKKPKKNPTDPDEYYRYCPITVLWPPEPLGDSLDFSQDSIRWRYTKGEEAARKIP
jgi:NTE family protein